MIVLTRTTTIRILRILGIILIIGIIVAYAIWRSFNYAIGPKISIHEPLDGSTVTSPTVSILGKVERASSFSLNGKLVSVDEQGNWDETLIIFPGPNTLLFSASDRFGRSVNTTLRLVGVEELPSSVPNTTTSTTTL